MAINEDNTNPKTYVVSYSKRHPITRQPVALRRKGIKSKAEAQRVFNELVVEVEDRLRRAIVPTWEKVVSEFLDASKTRGLSQTTVYAYEKCLNAHTMESWGQRLVDSITNPEIRTLLQDKLGQRAVSHQEYFFKVIRAVFKYALDNGFINRNPVPTMKFKLGEKIKGVLKEDEIRKLLTQAQAIDWEWYPHYALALYTGLRNGELYALTWDKVDLNQRTLLVNRSWTSMTGFKATKSEDDRLVEIAQPLIPLLMDLKADSEGSDFVLPRIDRWDRGLQARDLRLFCQTQSLPTIRFHDLRASWATLLLSKGVEPIKIMKMGGWKDLETMMIYARKAGVDIRGATECLDLHKHGAQIATVTHIGSVRSDL